MPTPTDLLERIRLDVERNALRARNGLKHLAGVGRPEVGCSPKDVVWRRDKVQLYRYHSPGPTLGPPILLVMSLVSKPYVLDLRPGNSFVEALVGRGFDVYMIDWGTPDAADADNSFETYCDEYIPFACAAAMRTSGADELHVFGYCFGGVLSLIFAAGHPEIPLRTLSLMATPVDFAAMGGMTSVLRDRRVDLSDFVDETGNVPAEAVLRGLTSARITGDAAMYATLLEQLENSEYIAAHQAMHGWATDHIPFPGACFRQTAEWFDPRQPSCREPARHRRRRTRSRLDHLPGDERRGHLRPSGTARIEPAHPRPAARPRRPPVRGGACRLDRGWKGAPGLDPRNARVDRRAQRQELTLTDLIEITPFAAADVNVVWGFFQRVPVGDRTLVKEPVTELGHVHAWVDDARAQRYVARIDDTVVGYVAVFPSVGWSRHVGEVRLVVDPTVRRRGIGQRLARHGFVSPSRRD